MKTLAQNNVELNSDEQWLMSNDPKNKERWPQKSQDGKYIT